MSNVVIFFQANEDQTYILFDNESYERIIKLLVNLINVLFSTFRLLEQIYVTFSLAWKMDFMLFR